MVFWKKWNLSFLKEYDGWRDQPPVFWLVIFLSILLFAAMIQWAWRFHLPAVTADVMPSPSAEIAQPAPLQWEKLTSLNLFGQNTEQNLGNLPETTLQLDLKGIYSDPKEEMGSVIIAVPGKQDQVYLIGDTVPGGAVLLNIYEDRVILRRAGQLEVLMLPQKKIEDQS